MTVRRGTNDFAVRALEALRGEPRSRAQLSSSPHAPRALARFESRLAAQRAEGPRPTTDDR